MEFIGGINPILEALKSESTRIQKIYLARVQVRGALKLISDLARQRGIPVSFKERRDLDRMVPGLHHQGALALVTPFTFLEIEDLLATCLGGKEKALLLVLDHIMDPHNLGALIRSAYAAGAHGVIMPRRRSSPVTPTVVKASAGAVEHLPLAQVSNVARTLDLLKDRGLWVLGAEATASSTLYQMDFRDHTALVLGSEGQGIRPLVREKCDFLFSIPLKGRLGSLNVAAAGAVALFEAVRQRSAPLPGQD